MKLEITETRDWSLVWQFCQAPDIVERIVNDAWREMGETVRRAHVKLIVENPRNHTLLVRSDDEFLGCFVLVWKAGNTFEVHTMLLPRCRGRHAIMAGRMAIQFAFALPDVGHLISYCPANNPQSYLFAIMCGWHKAGIAATQWIQDGIAYPMKIVEMDKTDLKEALCR